MYMMYSVFSLYPLDRHIEQKRVTWAVSCGRATYGTYVERLVGLWSCLSVLDRLLLSFLASVPVSHANSQSHCAISILISSHELRRI